MADKQPSKADALRAMREANYEARNTPEASGTARKAPSGKVVSAPASMAEPSRTPGRASTHPVAKATKGKTGTAVVKGHVRRSTTGTGLRVGEAGADQSKRGRGRPKANGPREWEKLGITERTYYRRKAEDRSK